MSAEENKALVRTFFEEVCNGMNLEAADRLFATDHAYHDPIIRAPLGPEGIKLSSLRTTRPSRTCSGWWTTWSRRSEISS